jgi:diaminohydroxyphosphoribosylaminopyrimidine deaminase/5-amino-6-(5-phosphoribosylamino)uracil reductase
MDRRRQVPASWIKEKRKQGFRVVPSEKITDFPSLLEFLGDQGVLEVLVEAGPTFSEFILTNGLWNESVRIEKTDLAADQIYVHRNY